MKIYVVSRAVPERMHTARLLNNAKIPFTLVVDNHEQVVRARNNGCFDTMAFHTEDLVEKRNKITEYHKAIFMRSGQSRYYIGLDDNIQEFTRVGEPWINNLHNDTSDGNNWRPRYNIPSTGGVYISSLEALAKLAEKIEAPYGGVATMENPFFRARRFSFRRFVKTKVFIMDATAGIVFKHPMCHDSYATALSIAKYGKVVVDNYLFYKANWYEKGGIGDRKRREELGLLDQLDSTIAEFPGLVARARGKNSALRVCKVADSAVDQWRRHNGYL